MATKLGDLLDEIVVVGGLVPHLLIDQENLPSGLEPHAGTMDLDMGLALAIVPTQRMVTLVAWPLPCRVQAGRNSPAAAPAPAAVRGCSKGRRHEVDRHRARRSRSPSLGLWPVVLPMVAAPGAGRTEREAQVTPEILAFPAVRTYD